jgi:hypothetical protein
VVAAITSEPVAFFRAAVTSPTNATLTDWSTQLDFSDAQPLSGSIELGGDGHLLISPTEPPFSIENCNFDMYNGAFNGVQGSGALRDAARRGRLLRASGTDSPSGLK